MGRAGARVTGRLTLLAATLRAGGVRLGVGEVLAAHRALAAIDPGDRAAAYFALRTTLCSRHEDLAAFDAAFAEWFGRPPAGPPVPPALDEVAALVLPRVAVPGTRAAAEQIGGAEVIPAAWSDVELLRDKDFAEYSAEERRRARRAMRRLAASVPSRPSHRRRPSRRRGAPPHGARPDLRRTVRASLRTQGDPLERHWREPGRRPRPLVLVCDVSGSMEPYARMLLAYMQACVAARRRVEAFVFGTKLTRVTAELRGRDPDLALERATQATTTGRAARGSARRSPRSTASMGAGWAEARWWCCSPTDGIAASPRSSSARSLAWLAAPTAWSGSIRSRRIRATSR